MSDRLEALEASAAHLATLVHGMSADELAGQSYASEWTFADVASHLGSGATIMRRGVDATISGEAVEDGFNQSVWDEWNAKAPEAKASDALTADRALLDRLSEMTDDEQASFQFSMGPMKVDLATFLSMRLSEHALHSWDIDVAIDPYATLPVDVVPFIFDVLPMITGFVGKSDGTERIVTIHTIKPEHTWELTVGPERLALASGIDSGTADVELSSEAFIRLVYGRLDSGHTPAGSESPQLEQLRALFPGV
jgi:uncharacterized protein (TIGR03083 family)